jgi:hypothetical protein
MQKLWPYTPRKTSQEQAPLELVTLVLPGAHLDPRIPRKLQRFVDRAQRRAAMPH